LAKHRGSSSELLEELQKIDTVYDSGKLLNVTDFPSMTKTLPPVIDTEAETVEEPSEHST